MPTQPASLLDRLLGTDASAGAGRLAALDRSQAVVEFSPDGTVLTANENFLRVFGCTLEQVRGRHHRMFVHADEGASPDYARFWQDLARGEYRSGQFRRVTPDGREVWLQATYNPVRDRTGKVVRVVKFAHDVSDRRREELDNVGQLQAIDRSMAVIEFSLDGTVLNANRNFLDALGYALEDVQGQHHRMFMPQGAADTAAYRELWAQLAQGRYESGQFERRAKDGRPVWIEASYNPILDASGRPYKVVKFATDVTAQRNRNADFEGQIAALHRAQAVIEFELDGTIRDANANFLAAVGYRREDIVGRHHSMFVEPGERDTPAYRAFWQALGRGESASDRYLRRRADGSALWLQASYSPILDASGRPYKVVKYCTDVTAQVQQAEALRTLFAQIEQVAENLLTGTREIAAGNGDLSVRTEHQASALEKTAATMEQLSGAITSTAHNAEMARDLTRDADEASVRGQQAVDRLAAAMRDIRDASRRVSELLGVIDAIAFQTNILALNAAVEAARAGDKGRGFAVVASEVRALAQRCSASAKEIKATLDVANAAVSIGGERVQDAGRAMDQIGSSVQSAARLAGEIADAAREQRTGIQQVNTALQSMEDVTQQNAALVEQIAASSGSLESMAASLSGALGDFQARDAGEAAQAPRARATHRPSMATH